MRRPKKTAFALLLGSLLIAGPVAGAPDRGERGGRGKQRVERAQQQKQVRAQRAQQRQQARSTRAAQQRAARQEARQPRAGRAQQRAEQRAERTTQRQARVERVQQRQPRAERAQQAQARNQARQAARAEQRREAREQRVAASELRQQQRVARQARAPRGREVSAERSRAGRERAALRGLNRERRQEVRAQRAPAPLQQRLEQRRERLDRRIDRRIDAPVFVDQGRERLARRTRLENERLRQLRLEERRLADRRAVAPLRDRSVAPMRFRGLDRDGDGQVARWEWRGNDVAFSNHDWNGDGVLRGAEVRPGAARTRPIAWRSRVVEWAPQVTRVAQPWPRVTERWLVRQRIQAIWPWLTRAERNQVAGDFSPPVDELERRVWERQRRAELEGRRLSWFAPQRWNPWADPFVVEPVVRVARPIALPPLDDFVWTGFDERLYERQVRVHDFGPVDLIVSRVDLAPVDRVLVVDRFSAYDLDRDRYVTLREWPGPRPLFYDLDRDRDDRLVVDDLLVARPRLEPVLAVDRERYVAFHLLDRDDDGVLAPWEWTGDIDLFFLLDADNDGVMEQSEYLGLARRQRIPLRVAYGADLDGDRRLVPVEWVGDPYRFARLDIDADGEIEPVEALVGWALRT